MRRFMMTVAVLGTLAWSNSIAHAGFSPQSPRWDDSQVSSLARTAQRIERQHAANVPLAAHCGPGYGPGGFTHAYRHGYRASYYRTGYGHVPRYPAYVPRPYHNPHHGLYHHRHYYSRPHYGGGGGRFGLYIGF